MSRELFVAFYLAIMLSSAVALWAVASRRQWTLNRRLAVASGAFGVAGLFAIVFAVLVMP